MERFQNQEPRTFVGYMERLIQEGWTQTEIATRLGLHRSTVNCWFQENSIPPDYRADYIAEAFGFSEEELREAIRRSRRQRDNGEPN